MFRVLIMAFVVLVMLPCASEPVLARAMERGDATAAR
jgi:hypothetical protein